jgi:hypothetical protein
MNAPHRHSRREFFVRTLVGSLVCSLARPWQTMLGAQQPGDKKYDLLIKGGKVVDPAQRLSAVRDMAITGHRVAQIATASRRWAFHRTPTALPRA